MGGEKKTLAMDLKSPDALSILPTNGNDVRGVAPLPSVCTYFERVGNDKKNTLSSEHEETCDHNIGNVLVLAAKSSFDFVCISFSSIAISNGGSGRSGIYLSFMTTLITMCLMDAISQTRAKDVHRQKLR